MTTIAEPLSEDRKARISRLFREGYSLDLICELGCTLGWKRADVLALLKERGWSLDWSGRLRGQRPVATNGAPLPGFRPSEAPTVSAASAEELISVSVDHPVAIVRLRAERAQAAIDALRAELMHQERVSATLAQRRWQESRSNGHSLPPAPLGQDQKASQVQSPQTAN